MRGHKSEITLKINFNILYKHWSQSLCRLRDGSPCLGSGSPPGHGGQVVGALRPVNQNYLIVVLCLSVPLKLESGLLALVPFMI